MEDYNEIEIHRRMLRDSIRCTAFQQACKAVIRPGDIVLDVGAGTGILSLFALQAGARKVYSVEAARIARVAQRIVTCNHADNRIIVLNDDIENVELPEPVDVIVSEWLGSMGVNENLLYPVLRARDRWLKPGGTLIPTTVEAWLAPVQYEKLEEEKRFWNSSPYSVNLHEIITEICHEPIYTCNDIQADDVMAHPVKLWSTDVSAFSTADATQPFTATSVLLPFRRGTIAAFAGWFQAELCKGISLTNSPYSTPTHWGRILFPLNPSIEVNANTQMSVSFTCIPVQGGCSDYKAKIYLGQSHYTHRWMTPRSRANIEGAFI